MSVNGERNHYAERGLSAELLPGRTSAPHLWPVDDQSSWQPGEPGLIPDPILGAACTVTAKRPLEVSLNPRMQPRQALTASWWLAFHGSWSEPAATGDTGQPVGAEEDDAASEDGGAGEDGGAQEGAGGDAVNDDGAADEPVEESVLTLSVIVDPLAPEAAVLRVSSGDEHLEVAIDLTDGDPPIDGPADDVVSEDLPAVEDAGETDPAGWRHVVVRRDPDERTFTVLIDGEVAGSTSIDDPHLVARREPRVVLALETPDEATSGLALAGPFRVYERVLTDHEVHLERHGDLVDLPTVDARNPLAFRLADDDDQAALYVTDDDIAGRTLHLVMENRSQFPMVLPQWTTGEVPSEYLEFRFRPGCLAGEAHHWVEPHAPGWRVESAPWGDGGVSLFVGRLEPLTLEPGQTTALTLHHVRASGDLGAHSTLVELVYTHPHHPRMMAARTSAARVVGRRGQRRSPLRFGVVGNRTVLNNGETENRVELYLANTSRTHPVDFVSRTNGNESTLVLSLDAAPEGEEADWALATLDELAGTTVSVEDRPHWHVAQELLGDSPQWTLTTTRSDRLEPGDRLVLALDDLFTSMPPGKSRVDLEIENLPGYWDDRRSTEVEKSTVRHDLPSGPSLQVNGKAQVIGEVDIVGSMSVGETMSVDRGLSVVGGAEVTGDVHTADGRFMDRFGELVPPGTIVMWHGREYDIPDGWRLCNGHHGTPDLTDRFPLATSQIMMKGPIVNNTWTGGEDRTGGNNSVQLQADQLPAHSDHHETAAVRTVPLGNPVVGNASVSGLSVKFESRFEDHRAQADTPKWANDSWGDGHNRYLVSAYQGELLPGPPNDQQAPAKHDLDYGRSIRNTEKVRRNQDGTWRTPTPVPTLPSFYRLIFIMKRFPDHRDEEPKP